MHASFDRWWNGISLRTKITGVTVLLLTFGLAVAGVGTANVLKQYLLEQTDKQISSAFGDLQAQLERGDAPSQSSIQTYYVGFLGDDDSLVLSNQSGSSGPDVDSLATGMISDSPQGLNLYSEDRTSQYRVKAFAFDATANGTTHISAVVIGIDLRGTDALVGRYSIIFFGFAIAVIVLGAALTQLLVTSTFTPLRDVERTAARFAAGDYAQRLGGATPNTEVGRLNRSLNTMLARIDNAFSERNRSIEQMRRFVGDASHELRTPLVSLRGYAELYRMGALQKPEDVAQAMDRIEREAIRMGGLVNDLLELARLDEAKAPELAPVDLLPLAQDAALDAGASNPKRAITVVVPDPDAVEAALASLPLPAPEAEETPIQAANRTRPIVLAGATLARLRGRRRPRGAETVVEPSAPAPLPAVGPIVLAEENKIRQVITNLMGNAMRFTPDDSPIELVVEVDAQGGFGAISIVDHGEGIPPQLREKIFQRFYRADTSRTRDTGGSGLGLAIVAGIVQNHRGHVEVLETPGGGATFRVSLPLLPRDPEVEPSTDDVAPAPEAAPRS